VDLSILDESLECDIPGKRGNVVMTPFEQYLELHELDPIRLSIEANVRYLTVYNAKKGNPILPENAKKIREAVFRLTGIPYVGAFVLIAQPGAQLPPPLRVKHIPRPHEWKR
jgi:hypothetical protein